LCHNREAALAEAQAAAEALAAREGDGVEGEGEGNAEADGGEDHADERDLDDDIPEADETGDWVDSDAEDEALPMHEVDGDFPADGVRIRLMGNGEMDMDQSGLGEEAMGRDLDDDVPDAGSYQHTDTDLEETSSEIMDAVEVSGLGAAELGVGRSSLAGRASIGSSVFRSSPMPPRTRNQR
jgi:hypothetical protein